MASMEIPSKILTRLGLDQFWLRLSEPSPAIRGSEQRGRARLLSALLVVLCALGLVALVFLLSGDASPVAIAITLLAIALLLTAYALSRTRFASFAAVLMVGIIAAAVLSDAVIEQGPYALDFLAVSIILGSVFLSRRATFAIYIAVVAATLGLSRLQSSADLINGRNDVFFLISVGILTLITTFVHERDLTQISRQAHELAKSEARLANILDTGSEMIIATDAQQRIILLNQAAQQALGYRPSEILGESMQLLVPERFRDRHQQMVETFLGSVEHNRRIGQRVPILVRRRDGSEFPTEAGISKVEVGGETFATFIGVDITERRRAEEKIHQQLRRLSALRAIDVAITSVIDLNLTLKVLLEQVTDLLEVDAAAVLLLDPQSNLLRFKAGRGLRSREYERRQVRLGEDYAGTAALERRVTSNPDLRTRRNGFVPADLLAVEGVVAYFGVPLVAKGQVKGVLELLQRAPLDPSDDWFESAEAFALQGAIAIDNAELFENLQHSNFDLTVAYDSTIEGWSCALDMRDEETHDHTLRVTALTLQLARAMHVSDRELVHIRHGALLHDIGKMGIPDEILLKPGPLSDDEWRIMRKHPTYALELLSSIAYLRPALDIPFCHHEKWDGSGYPRQLKGKEIPLAARIFAVVDVWDALTSDRRYRPAWTAQAALEHIAAQAGKHFDPDVVPIFLELIAAQTAEGRPLLPKYVA